MEGPRPDKFYKCFRIVKTQKISRGDSAHVMGSPFAPNEVPAPVLQRRFPARPQKVWGHGAVSRSDGLWRVQGSVWRKPGTVRTLRLASFKRKNNTLKLCSQQPKTNFGILNNYVRFYLWKRKIPPTQRSDGFCRVNRRQNRSGVLRGGKFFCGLSLTEVVGLTVITDHFLWLCSKMNTTTSCRWIRTNPQKQWDLWQKYHGL